MRLKQFKKKDLIEFANRLDFNIVDLALVNGKEHVGHKMNDSDEIVYLPIEDEGSGFNQLFRGFSRYCDDVTRLVG